MAIAEKLRIEVEAQVNKAISDMNRFNQTTQKSKTGISSLTSTIGKWALGVGAAVVSIQALRKAMDYAFDAAKYAAEASQVEKAFQNIAKQAGTSSAEVVSSLREMSLGTVSDLKLMQAASRAALFDIPLDKLDEMMHVAMASATATGQSVEYMFDSIVTGVGRAQPLILDNLGLTLKVGEATKAYADKLGKSTEQLTAAERKQAILNATLEAGAALTAKVGDAALEMTDLNKYENAQAAFENLRKELGTFMLPAFRKVSEEASTLAVHLADIIRQRNIMRDLGNEAYSTAEKISAITKEIEKQIEIKEVSTFFDDTYLNQLIAERAALGRLQSAEQLTARYRKMQEEEKEKEAAAEAERARLAAQRAEERRKETEEILADFSMTEAGKREELQKTIEKYEAYAQTYPAMQPIISAVLDELQKELEEMNRTVGEITETYKPLNSIIDETAGGYDSLIVGAKGTIAEFIQLSGIMPTLTQQFTGMKTQIEEVLPLFDNFGRKIETSINVDNLADMESRVIGTFQNIKTSAEELETSNINWGDELLSSFNNITSSLSTMWNRYHDQRLAGMDKESAEYKKIAREQAQAEKNMAIFQATVNTAAAVVKSLAVGGPAGIALAALTAAMGAAQIGAIVATPLPALERGGVITKPTTVLAGEKGPEAIIPLDQAGGVGGNVIIVQNVRGSVITERQLQRFALGGVMRMARGY